VGVPGPAGAVLLLLPVYLGFIGVPLAQPAAYGAAAYTVAVALLLISRIRVYSAKGPSRNIRRDMVPPAILLVVLYVLLFFNYTWYTLAISSLLYLLLLPLSMRAYAARHRRETQAPEVVD